MAELFIKQAKNYAEGRPSYPPELFEFIASKTSCQDLAWDVGTGTGQAAQSVSFFFPFLLLKVVAFFSEYGILGKIHFGHFYHHRNIRSLLYDISCLKYWEQIQPTQIPLRNF